MVSDFFHNLEFPVLIAWVLKNLLNRHLLSRFSNCRLINHPEGPVSYNAIGVVCCVSRTTALIAFYHALHAATELPGSSLHGGGGNVVNCARVCASV